MIISAGKISRFTDFLCIQFMGLRTRVCSKIEFQVTAQRIILSVLDIFDPRRQHKKYITVVKLETTFKQDQSYVDLESTNPAVTYATEHQ